MDENHVLERGGEGGLGLNLLERLHHESANLRVSAGVDPLLENVPPLGDGSRVDHLRGHAVGQVVARGCSCLFAGGEFINTFGEQERLQALNGSDVDGTGEIGVLIHIIAQSIRQNSMFAKHFLLRVMRNELPEQGVVKKFSIGLVTEP